MAAFSDYRVPDAAASDDTKAGWVRECLQAGQQWLKMQKPWADIEMARDLVFNSPDEDMPVEMSRVKIPRTKRQIRELVAILSNLKATASNRTDNKELYDQSVILNKVDNYWWQTTLADRQFRKGFQAAAVDGTAYLSHVWDPDLLGPGRGDIRTDVFNASDVYLIQPPQDYNLQRCYAVVMRRRVPLFEVHRKYPLRAHEITAEHGAFGYTQQGTEYVQSFMQSPLKHVNGVVSDKPSIEDIFPSVDVYEFYIQDMSINLTGRTVKMGKPNASWAYDVPAYGSQVPTGTNGWEGLPLHRSADMDDARLYPFRRKIIATEKGTILSDGPSEAWHAMVPAARISFDDWWCQPLGYSLAHDAVRIEQDVTAIARGISDAAMVRLAPPMAYDENLVSDRLAERLNPRQPRQMLKLNMQMGDAIKPILPANYADLPTYIPEWVKFLNGEQDFVVGVRDLLAVAKAKQIPSADSLEKILEMAGPLAQDMTRGMEAGMRDLGEMRRYLNMQFRPVRQRLQILGSDGVTSEDIDWDPGTMVPAHMAGERPEDGPSRLTYAERAREHAQKFYYFVVPNSLARLQQMSQKLIMIQLGKSGLLPVDPWTIAKLFEIDDFGPEPNGTRNIMERFVAWEHMKAELAAEAAQGMPQAGKQGRGRPSSNQRPPQLKQKDQGTRTTVATSR